MQNVPTHNKNIASLTIHDVARSSMIFINGQQATRSEFFKWFGSVQNIEDQFFYQSFGVLSIRTSEKKD